VEAYQIQNAVEISGQPSVGNCGRLLAYLYDEDGRNLNLEMVKLGWTASYRKYGDGRIPVSFTQAHLDASVNRRGIWQVR
jgi:endonuclease YncB( thermonuclease family)